MLFCSEKRNNHAKQIISSFFWTFKGKIMCRKAMNTLTIIIKNEEDINQKLNR